VDKLPEGDRFSSERLADDLCAQGRNAHAFPDTDAILHFLSHETIAGDVVLIMSNGSFDNLGSRLVESLKERET